jgi:hypothetical protein
MLFSTLRVQQNIPQNQAVPTITAAALGMSRAEYAPPKMPVTFWPDFPAQDLHTVRAGGQTIGKLLELAFESSPSISQREYARMVSIAIDTGIEKLDTDARSRNFLPTEELLKRLLSDELVDERAIPRHDNPADLIAQTIRHAGGHLVETYSSVTRLHANKDLLQAHVARASQLCDLTVSLEDCELRVNPLAIHLVVPADAFYSSSVLRGKAAAFSRDTGCSFFDRSYLDHDPTVELHEMMHSFNAAILQSGWTQCCGTASIRALRHLRLEQVRARQPFPADILDDLWKGILCDLHDELLADAAQLSATNTPPRTIPEGGISEHIVKFFDRTDPQRAPFMRRGYLSSRASLQPFAEAVKHSGASTAGTAICEVLSQLRYEQYQFPRHLQPKVAALAERTALEFCRSVNSLFSAVYHAFCESREAGFAALGTATLLNPWQFDRISRVLNSRKITAEL